MASNMRAFPTYAHPDSQAGAECSGMTLRDWFAGQAIPAIIAATSAGRHSVLRDGEQGTSAIQSGMARDAYALADALLAERERDNPTLKGDM